MGAVGGHCRAGCCRWGTAAWYGRRAAHPGRPWGRQAWLSWGVHRWQSGRLHPPCVQQRRSKSGSPSGWPAQTGNARASPGVLFYVNMGSKYHGHRAGGKLCNGHPAWLCTAPHRSPAPAAALIRLKSQTARTRCLPTVAQLRNYTPTIWRTASRMAPVGGRVQRGVGFQAAQRCHGANGKFGIGFFNGIQPSADRSMAVPTLIFSIFSTASLPAPGSGASGSVAMLLPVWRGGHILESLS